MNNKSEMMEVAKGAKKPVTVSDLETGQGELGI